MIDNMCVFRMVTTVNLVSILHHLFFNFQLQIFFLMMRTFDLLS